MDIAVIVRSIEASEAAQTIKQSIWIFPAAETIHVIAIALVVGTIAVLDLRLLGFSWTRRPVREIATEILPWTWSCFCVAALAGAVMFVSASGKYAADLPFQLKMGLLLLAGLNMLVFHAGAYASVAAWDRDRMPPRAARIGAGLSLLFWIAIVTCGRLVSFTTEDQFGPPPSAQSEH